MFSLSSDIEGRERERAKLQYRGEGGIRAEGLSIMPLAPPLAEAAEAPHCLPPSSNKVRELKTKLWFSTQPKRPAKDETPIETFTLKKIGLLFSQIWSTIAIPYSWQCTAQCVTKRIDLAATFSFFVPRMQPSIFTRASSSFSSPIPIILSKQTRTV